MLGIGGRDDVQGVLVLGGAWSVRRGLREFPLAVDVALSSAATPSRSSSCPLPALTPHEADPKGRFTTDNAREMGASGAAKREERWQDRVSTTRQELAAHPDLAIERLRAILGTGRDADALRAAIGAPRSDRSGATLGAGRDRLDLARRAMGSGAGCARTKSRPRILKGGAGRY